VKHWPPWPSTPTAWRIALLSKLMLSKDSLDLLLAKELVTVEIRRHAPSERHEHWLAQPELPLNS
jgi:primosomal protein N' (replication factor Y) (superfamily II helicase)